jgi:type IV secretion system protein VirB11
MTYARMHGIAVMAAAQTRQEITHRSPILTADLPGELRLEAVMPPVQMPGTMALTFRRVDKELDEIEAMPSLYDTSRWNQWADRKQRMQARDALLLTHYDAGDIISFHKELAKARKTGLFCGATGAGKTRLSKMLGGAIPLHERIIAIEDARELVIRQPNHVRHFYSGGDSGVRPAKLLKTTLRERPDRVLLAEMRDPEAAAVFISDVMAGHPGSLSTIHGGYPGEAARRLVDLLSDGKTTGVETIIAQLEAAIDFIIPVENDGGIRSIGAIWFRADAARRGETFRDLLKDVQ